MGMLRDCIQLFWNGQLEHLTHIRAIATHIHYPNEPPTPEATAQGIQQGFPHGIPTEGQTHFQMSSPKPGDTTPQNPMAEGTCRTWDNTFSKNPSQRHPWEQILAPHPEQRPSEHQTQPKSWIFVGYSHCIHPEIQMGFKNIHQVWLWRGELEVSTSREASGLSRREGLGNGIIIP